MNPVNDQIQTKNLLDTWEFPKIGVPQYGWFIMEKPIKMYELGGFPIFLGWHPHLSEGKLSVTDKPLLEVFAREASRANWLHGWPSHLFDQESWEPKGTPPPKLRFPQ